MTRIKLYMTVSSLFLIANIFGAAEPQQPANKRSVEINSLLCVAEALNRRSVYMLTDEIGIMSSDQIATIQRVRDWTGGYWCRGLLTDPLASKKPEIVIGIARQLERYKQQVNDIADSLFSGIDFSQVLSPLPRRACFHSVLLQDFL